MIKCSSIVEPSMKRNDQIAQTLILERIMFRFRMMLVTDYGQATLVLINLKSMQA